MGSSLANALACAARRTQSRRGTPMAETGTRGLRSAPAPRLARLRLWDTFPRSTIPSLLLDSACLASIDVARGTPSARRTRPGPGRSRRRGRRRAGARARRCSSRDASSRELERQPEKREKALDVEEMHQTRNRLAAQPHDDHRECPKARVSPPIVRERDRAARRGGHEPRAATPGLGAQQPGLDGPPAPAATARWAASTSWHLLATARPARPHRSAGTPRRSARPGGAEPATEPRTRPPAPRGLARRPCAPAAAHCGPQRSRCRGPRRSPRRTSPAPPWTAAPRAAWRATAAEPRQTLGAGCLERTLRSASRRPPPRPRSARPRPWNTGPTGIAAPSWGVRLPAGPKLAAARTP